MASSLTGLGPAPPRLSIAAISRSVPPSRGQRARVIHRAALPGRVSRIWYAPAGRGQGRYGVLKGILASVGLVSTAPER